MQRVLFFAGVCFAASALASALWPALERPRARMFLVVCSAVTVAAWAVPVLLGRGVHGVVPVFGEPLKLVGSVWLVTGLFVILLGGPVWVLQKAVARRRRRRAAGEGRPAPDQVDLSRRGFLSAVGRGVPAAAAITGAAGVLGAVVPFRIKRETVRIRGLPSGLDGFRIGQLTDVHVGAFVTPSDLARAVRTLDAEGVDLQVMTGDLIDDLSGLDETMDALGDCRAQHGMVAIYGNHEHWRGITAIRRRYQHVSAQGRPLQLLVDESLRIDHGGAAIRLVGVDYPVAPHGRQKEFMEASAARAFAGVQPGETIVCLSHHPDFFPIAAARGARLTLSGHTHGGQVIGLGALLFSVMFQHLRGWYRQGDSQLYVSSGTGHWLPLRIGVPAEVTVVTLQAV